MPITFDDIAFNAYVYTALLKVCRLRYYAAYGMLIVENDFFHVLL